MGTQYGMVDLAEIKWIIESAVSRDPDLTEIDFSSQATFTDEAREYAEECGIKLRQEW